MRKGQKMNKHRLGILVMNVRLKVWFRHTMAILILISLFIFSDIEEAMSHTSYTHLLSSVDSDFFPPWNDLALLPTSRQSPLP